MSVNLKGVSPADAAALNIPIMIQHTDGRNVDVKDMFDFIRPPSNIVMHFDLPFTLTTKNNGNSYTIFGVEKYEMTELKFHPESNGSYRIYNMRTSRYLCKGDFFILKFTPKAEIVEVEFTIDDAEMLDSKPIVLATKHIRNTSTREQNMAFSYTELVRDTSTFSHTSGLEVEAGTEFKTRIPFITEGKVQVKGSKNDSWIWGEDHTEEKTYSYTHNLIGEPGKMTTGKIIIQRVNLKVPYKITLKTEGGRIFHSRGVWESVSHWDIRFDVDSISIE